MNKRLRKGLIITAIVVAVIAALLLGGWLYLKSLDTMDLREVALTREQHDSIQEQFPDCEIRWMVPFQGGYVDSHTTELTVTDLTQNDVPVLERLLRIRKLDASACKNYALLMSVQEQYPGMEVIYYVDLGTQKVLCTTDVLSLENSDSDYTQLERDLVYLPELEALHLNGTKLPLEQLEALKEKYPAVAVSYTADILGECYAPDVTELDLSAATAEDIPDITAQLLLLPEVKSIFLSGPAAGGQLGITEVSQLKESFPEVSFEYTFDFFGEQISTLDEEVVLTGKDLSDSDADQVRQMLDVMENCKRLVLDDCGFSNELLAQLRDEYRDRTKIVWRIRFGKSSCLTDVTVLRATYTLRDYNVAELVYLEDVEYVDIGHNDYLTTVSFVSGWVNLKMMIASGSPITDLSGFAVCKKLEILELAYCGLITDISPLKECESLTMLNISHTAVKSLEPLMELDITILCSTGPTRLTTDEMKAFEKAHPDCLITYGGANPYGTAWRYYEDNSKREWYAHIGEIFGYPRPWNDKGWYY